MFAGSSSVFFIQLRNLLLTLSNFGHIFYLVKSNFLSLNENVILRLRLLNIDPHFDIAYNSSRRNLTGIHCLSEQTEKIESAIAASLEKQVRSVAGDMLITGSKRWTELEMNTKKTSV